MSCLKTEMHIRFDICFHEGKYYGRVSSRHCGPDTQYFDLSTYAELLSHEAKNPLVNVRSRAAILHVFHQTCQLLTNERQKEKGKVVYRYGFHRAVPNMDEEYFFRGYALRNLLKAYRHVFLSKLKQSLIDAFKKRDMPLAEHCDAEEAFRLADQEMANRPYSITKIKRPIGPIG